MEPLGTSGQRLQSSKVLNHMLNFKHMNSITEVNGTTQMLKVRLILKGSVRL